MTRQRPRRRECVVIGLRLYSQYLVLDRGANAAGLTFTNGVATTLSLR